jgi:hypothetical protein
LGLGSDALSSGKNLSLEDMDGACSSGMSSSHLVVHLGHGTAEGEVSELLVHVNQTLSGLILESDSVVSDGVALSLEDLVDGDNLSVGRSNLVLSLHLIPESGSSENDVLGENSNSVKSWLWLSLSWNGSSDDPVLSELQNTHK